MNSLIVILFRCAQSELYSVARIGWTAFKQRLSVFTPRKPYYTLAYADAAFAEIDAASALPDMDARNAQHGSLGLLVAAAAENARFHWQLLKSHIIRAYPNKVEQQLKFADAGMAYYVSSSNDDWEDINALMQSGYNFMVANEAALVAGDNMPPTFTADFTDAKNDFSSIYLNYMADDGNVAAKTDAKRIANNAVYLKIMEMFKDATLYYKDDPVTKQLFVFEKVLELVSSKAPASLDGIITNSTNAPLSGATLSLYDTTDTSVDAHYTTTSVSDGTYDFGSVAGDTYTIKIEHSGFVTRIESISITPTISTHKNFELVTS